MGGRVLVRVSLFRIREHRPPCCSSKGHACIREVAKNADFDYNVEDNAEDTDTDDDYDDGDDDGDSTDAQLSDDDAGSVGGGDGSEADDGCASGKMARGGEKATSAGGGAATAAAAAATGSLGLNGLSRYVCRLDGRMRPKQRDSAMARFKDDPECRVIFCSLKACGVGINLTSANKLILLDPWWNPAAEEQAIDRIYRIGQERPVQITRFVMEGSIEDRMLTLAKRKREVYEGALAKKSAADLRKIQWENMSSLFSDDFDAQFARRD